VWEAVNVTVSAAEPRVVAFGRRVLVVWAGALWESLGEAGRMARDGSSFALAQSRLPALDVENGIALMGDGYVALIPGEDAAEFESVPQLMRHTGLLTEASIEKVAAPLPRERALGFKRYTVSLLPLKGNRFVDIGGKIWEAAGMKPGDRILVTRFADGARITKATGDQNDGVLVGKEVEGKGVYAHKRFGEAVLGNIQAKSVRVAFTKDALILLGDDVKLADFGLASKYHVAGAVRVQDGEFQRNSGRRITNFSVYPMRRDEPRIQVQGDWLERFGFVPGVRFTLEDHPLIRGRVLARIDPEGEHTVTQHHQGLPGGKLYIPTKHLAHFSSPDVKVWGTVEGLHVQQHFASSWKNG
jgi:hypothetical protein